MSGSPQAVCEVATPGRHETSVAPHYWLLLLREPVYKFETTMQEGAPGYGMTEIREVGKRETWYCTRCRLVEERVV